MSARIEMLLEVLRRYPNQYVVCSLVAKRARQLIEQNAKLLINQAINQALLELLDGRLKYESPQQVLQTIEETSEHSLNETKGLVELNKSNELADEAR